MKTRKYPLFITLTYLVISILWITLSDQVVLQFPAEIHAELQTVKGWLFVIVTGILIYCLIKKENLVSNTVIQTLRSKKNELNSLHSKNTSMLEALPVAIIEVDFSKVKQHLDQAMASFNGELEDWFKASPEKIYPVLDQIEITSVDGAACELFQMESPEALIANFKTTFTATSIENIKDDLICFYQGQRSVRKESEFARSDGSVFEASTFASIAPDTETPWQRLVVVIEDITEKAAATKAVNSFFDLGVNLHLIAGMDGTIYRANQGWKTVLDYSPDELEGQLFLDLVHPDDIEKTLNEMAALEEGKTTFFFENRYRSKQGEYRLLTWSAITPPESKLIYAVATDITQQRQAEEQLHRAASIIQCTSEGAIVTDLEGNIIDVNPAFTSITGYEQKDVIGQKPSILSSGKHDRCFYTDMWNALRETGLWQGEIWNKNKAGDIYPEYLTINRLNNNQGVLQGYVGVFTDLSALKKSEDTIFKLSTQDTLTGLPNGNAFTERLLSAIELASQENTQLCILSLDIDNFKLINESLGVTAGDELLTKVANRLQHSIRSEDFVARFGGDEFKLLITGCQNTLTNNQVIETLQQAFKEPFQQSQQLVHLTASIGVSQYPSDGQSNEELIRNADTALSQAKQNGSSQYKYYSKDLTEAALESMFIENALRVVIEQQQLLLLYQPQFDINTGQLVGMEALIRWQHPQIGQVSPMKFIPVAERTGMIQEIGTWVIETACKQAKEWSDKGYEFGRIAVNVSGSQLTHGDLGLVVNNALQASQLNPDRLELEVTESVIMQNANQASETLNKLRKLGIQTAIDDFGTGYSSLSYLKKLPIDKLKIDRSFVSELPDSSDGYAIIDAIISLGKALNLTLIAEGVEISGQETLLQQLGCHYVQGFLHSKPLTSEQIVSIYLDN